MNAPMNKAEAVAARDTRAFTAILRDELRAGIDNIPDELKSHKCWLVWKLIQRDDELKPRKVPIYPRTGQPRKGEQGGALDLENLGTWSDAQAAFSNDKSLAGVGFATLAQFGIVALDVDHCIKNGSIRDDAATLADLTYCEISPSDTGIRAFWLGSASDGKNHKEGFELFHSQHFVTVTGKQVENTYTLLGSALPTLDTTTRARLETLSRAAPSAGKVRTLPARKVDDLERLATLHGVNAETIEDLRSALEAIPADGGYDDWFHPVLALASLKPTEFAAEAYELADEWSQRFDAYDADDLARKWRGGAPKDLSYKSIFKWATDAGWANPRKGERVSDLGPIPFDAESPPTQWPTDAMPAAMQQAAAAIAYHVQAPEAVTAFAVLGAVAHLAQGMANAEGAKGDAMPCSLFTLALLGSGDRKSACFKHATIPISNAEIKARIEHKQIVAELDREAKARKKAGEQNPATKPADPRTIYGGDSTVEAIARDFVQGSKPALTWATDEGGIVFGGHSLKSETRLAAMGMFTRLFDGSGIDRSRVTEGIGSGFRFHIRFGMFLSCQPIAAREALADPLMQGQGLLPRFLLCAPDSLAGTRIESLERLEARPIADSRIQAYWGGLQCLMHQPPQTDDDGNLSGLPIVRQDEEAKAVWLAYYNRIELMQGADGEFANLRPFAGRSAEHASRLATVFAVWRCTIEGFPLQVTADDMRGAVSIAEYSLMEWQRHLTTCRLTPRERDAQTLLAWLQGKAWHQFTLSQLATGGPNSLRKDKPRRRAAVEELCKRGWLKERTDGYVLLDGESSCPTC